MSGSHGPYQFSHAAPISELHFLGEFCLHFGVGVTNCSVELLEPCGISGQRRWSILCAAEVLHPAVEVIITYLINEGFAGYFDIIPHLQNVNAVVHVLVALPFHQY